MLSELEKKNKVKFVLLAEGTGNLLIFCIKLFIGFSTNSFAIIGDAIHSLTDIGNNIIALFIIHHSYQPPDKLHPYGHRKYETISVFALATLLTVLAFQLGLNSFRKQTMSVSSEPLELYIMISALIANIAMALWQKKWSKKLNSQILLADAHHTFADAFTTIIIIISWQLSAQGYYWIDKLGGLLISCFIFYIAFGLFKRSIPILVDSSNLDHNEITKEILNISGVESVIRIRSRSLEDKSFVDIVISVNPKHTITSAHGISNQVEILLLEKFNISDISVHVEPSLP